MATNVAARAHSTPPPREVPPLREERWHDHLVPALRTTAVTLVLTGLLYPLVMTGISQALFHEAAEGSFVADAGGKVVGSALMAQGFSGAAYFQPRPSAAGEKGYDPLASGGSNFGATSKKLQDRAVADLDRLKKENPDAPGAVPVELLTASASGLDPHLSPAAALWQAPRVSRARGVSIDRIQAIVEEYTEGRQLGILGQPRVNALELNLAMDRRFGVPGTSTQAVPSPPAGGGK